jgi:hypothetical protein
VRLVAVMPRFHAERGTGRYVGQHTIKWGKKVVGLELQEVIISQAL